MDSCHEISMGATLKSSISMIFFMNIYELSILGYLMETSYFRAPTAASEVADTALAATEVVALAVA